MRLDDRRSDKQNDRSDKKTGCNRSCFSLSSQSPGPFQLTCRCVLPVQAAPGEATAYYKDQLVHKWFPNSSSQIAFGFRVKSPKKTGLVTLWAFLICLLLFAYGPKVILGSTPTLSLAYLSKPNPPLKNRGIPSQCVPKARKEGLQKNK